MSDKVLVIDDDPNLVNLFRTYLESANYRSLSGNDGKQGLRLFHAEHPALVILDIDMPEMNGWVVCQRIREVANTPIMMLTASAVTEDDIAHGLDLGADEYLVKPIRRKEFLARVRALLRRAQLGSAGDGKHAGYHDDYLHVDLNARRVMIGGKELRLTPTEFRLLETFVRHPDQVLTFAQLLEQVWGWEYETEYHYPRIYVSHLRRKIEQDPKDPIYIQNEYGVGYRFMPQK